MLVYARPVSEITERIIAIVRFGPPTESDGLRAGEYFQVCVDPYKFSPCGTFIRFGMYPGDEIVGWQHADRLFVVGELAKVPGGINEDQVQKKLKLQWGESPALSSPEAIPQ
jgi:hypothetical protein